MHDVATTSKTIASARRPDIFIASPGREVTDKHRLLSGHRPQRRRLQRLLVAYPTSGLRCHTFQPVKVRETLGTGRRHDSSSKPRVAGLTYSSRQLQTVPADVPPFRVPASN